MQKQTNEIVNAHTKYSLLAGLSILRVSTRWSNMAKSLMIQNEPKRARNFPAMKFPDQNICSYYVIFLYNFEAYEAFMKLIQWYYDNLANVWV